MSELTEEIPGPVGGDGGQQTPPGWQQREITDILTPEQLRKVQLIMKKHEKDPDGALPAFKQYFRTIAPDLEAKGVVADYLAYVLYVKMLKVI